MNSKLPVPQFMMNTDIIPSGEVRDNPIDPLYATLSTISMALGAYHGYKRNDSIGWALAWAAAGGLFPVVTPAIAFAQGFGEPKR